MIMKTVCSNKKCNGCMVCVDFCPKGCIHVKDNVEYLEAEIDERYCINCNLCEQICPNVNQVEKRKPIAWKQGWTKDKTRILSSSGGIALSLIRRFILDGGYVASCCYKQEKFIFDITNDFEISKQFAGSKYVKSNPIGIYNKIKKIVKDNKVLFIGLPCQVAALKNVVKSDNLYTVDLICHGTPSHKLFEKYILEKKYKLNTIKEVKFRTNEDMGLCINGKKINHNRVIDEYLCAFLEAIDYTENCYMCQYASLERVSDITLGDSWGTEYIEEKKNGISLVLVQTEKGQQLLEKCDLTLQNVDLDRAIQNNHQLSHPSFLSKKRKIFMTLLSKNISFKFATFITLPTLVIKQKIKNILCICHILK